MAFPTIPTASAGRVLSNTQADTTATRTFPSLTGLTKNSGDLLIAICFAYQTSTGTDAAFSGWTGSFTEFADFATSTTCAIGAAYKWSDGTETGTIAVTQAGAIVGHAAMILLSIPGAHASSVPEAGGSAAGTGSADPGSLDPAGWAAEDTLWIAVAAIGETSTSGAFTGAASAPANYSDYADTGISGDAIGGIEGAVAFRQLNAASEDPGTFTNDTSSSRWRALTIAVRPVASVAHTATPTDTLSLSDSAAAAKAIPKSVSDSLTGADSFSRVHEAARTPADTIALADQLSSAKTVPKGLADSLALTDSAAPVLGRDVALDDSLSLGDVIAISRGLGHTDAVALADELSRALELSRSIADGTAASDALARGLAPALVDSLALADQLSRAVEALRTLADPVALSDEATPDLTSVGEYHVNPDDALDLADQLERIVESIRTFADTVALADEATPNLTTGASDYTRQIDDTTALADSLSRVSEYQRTPAETLSLADLLARAVTYERGISDLLELADLAAPEIPGITLIDDTISLDDELLSLLTHSAIRTGHIAHGAQGFAGMSTRGRVGAAENGHVEQVVEGVIAR